MNPETWALLGAAFGAAGQWAVMRFRLAKNERDMNGLGKKAREIEARAQRRWLHMIATQIETSATLEEARQHAKLLREDAWRD